MQNLIEETIIFLVDVSAPAAQAGRKGDVRTVGRDISNYAADWLVHGGQARHIQKDQVQDVLIELGLEEPGPRSFAPMLSAKADTGAAGEETKPQRRTHARKRDDSRADKGGDNKSEDGQPQKAD